jgi:hypothetical protein
MTACSVLLESGSASRQSSFNLFEDLIGLQHITIFFGVHVLIEKN